MSSFAYDWGMVSIDQYLDDRLAHGRGYFSREEAQHAVDLTPSAFAVAVTRLKKKKRLANPRHDFYLILPPEDRIVGAPDPARWIDRSPATPRLRDWSPPYANYLPSADCFCEGQCLRLAG